MHKWEQIIHLDHWLFFKINGAWTSHLLDTVLPFMRESIFWIPLYLFLGVFIGMNFGIKGLFWAVALICTASICDILSSHLIKEMVYRMRPCRNPDIAGDVRFLVKYCPMSSSFISSHATTHFGMAMFIYTTLKPYTSPWTGILFVWAALIAYAQVYVGVHFPSDVLCGSFLGLGIGLVMSKFYVKHIGLTAKSFQNT